MEISKFFVGRGRKGQAVFSPLVLLRGSEAVGQNWNGKTSHSDRRSVSECEGWSGRVARLPQGLGEILKWSNQESSNKRGIKYTSSIK